MSKWHRLQQVMKFGWQHASQISQESFDGKKKLSLFLDIYRCYKQYGMWSNQYLKEKFWELDKQRKEEVAKRYSVENSKREEWVKGFYENRKFLVKWSKFEIEADACLKEKRNEAYSQRYGMGKGCIVEYGVELSRQHYLDGTIKIGENVLLAKNVFIDYSGDVEIYNDVKIANGVIIESHTHSLYKTDGSAKKGHLVIEEGVKILSRAYIADTCHRIGRHARIGAQSCVRNNVPPYAIVMGNPAKIVGFVYTPEEMENFEIDNYADDNRTSIETYTREYQRYYKDNAKELAHFVKLKA